MPSINILRLCTKTVLVKSGFRKLGDAIDQHTSIVYENGFSEDWFRKLEDAIDQHTSIAYENGFSEDWFS